MSYWELCQMSGISANDPNGIDKLIDMYSGNGPCCEYCDIDYDLIEIDFETYICQECWDSAIEDEGEEE